MAKKSIDRGRRMTMMKKSTYDLRCKKLLLKAHTRTRISKRSHISLPTTKLRRRNTATLSRNEKELDEESCKDMMKKEENDLIDTFKLNKRKRKMHELLINKKLKASIETVEITKKLETNKEAVENITGTSLLNENDAKNKKLKASIETVEITKKLETNKEAVENITGTSLLNENDAKNKMLKPNKDDVGKMHEDVISDQENVRYCCFINGPR